MKASDYIVEFFIEKGITDVFGYPGGMVTHLMDSFGKYKGQIAAHVNYHEQASAFAACGYAQIKHLPGVAYATSGPGATNLITGIANAYFDSTPCIFITGQVNTYESKGDTLVRQRGFQETDILKIVEPITKYSVQVTHQDELRYELEKAFQIAMEGRPGPVLLDIPMNIQRQDVEPEGMRTYTCEETNKEFKDQDYETILNALAVSKRPCVLVGAGIKNSGLVEVFRQGFASLPIPVVSSMIAVDVMPADCENYYGFIGAYGHRAANFIVAKSDLIISLGSRLDCRQTGTDKTGFAPNAKLIRIEVDENEATDRIKEEEIQIIAKLTHENLRLLGDRIKTGLSHDYSNWQEVCGEIKTKLQDIDAGKTTNIIKELSIHIPDHVVITTDVGQNQVWIPQAFEFKNDQQVLFSGGHGAMGYSLPAAIGAHYASHGKVYSFNGDGGVQMNLQELQFIARERLPIKIIIMNNSSLGMIRHFQEMYFESKYIQTVDEFGYSVPDFGKLANAYDIPYFKIAGNGISSDLHENFEKNEPAIIEVDLNYFTYVFPKLSMGHPCQDQDPLLERSLYEYLMNL